MSSVASNSPRPSRAELLRIKALEIEEKERKVAEVKAEKTRKEAEARAEREAEQTRIRLKAECDIKAMQVQLGDLFSHDEIIHQKFVIIRKILTLEYESLEDAPKFSVKNFEEFIKSIYGNKGYKLYLRWLKLRLTQAEVDGSNDYKTFCDDNKQIIVESDETHYKECQRLHDEAEARKAEHDAKHGENEEFVPHSLDGELKTCCGKSFIPRDLKFPVIADGKIESSIAIPEAEVVKRFVEVQTAARLIAFDTTSGGTPRVFSRLVGQNLWREGIEALVGLVLEERENIIYESVIKVKKLIDAEGNVKYNQREHIFQCLPNCRVARTFAEACLSNVLRTANAESSNLIDTITRETTGRVFYKNGYYDLANKRFVSVDEDPLATTFVRVERNFFSYEDWNSMNYDSPSVLELKRRFLMIYGGEDEIKFVLRLDSRAIGGHANDKIFVLIIGPRNSGKSVRANGYMAVFGDGYIGNFSPPVCRGGSSDPAAANREIISCKMYLRRIVFSNETTTTVDFHNGGSKMQELDALTLKRWASGDRVTCRAMRENERELSVTAKMMINVNSIPPFAGCGDYHETMALIKFPNKFISQGEIAASANIKSVIIKDPSISEYIFTHRFALALTWCLFNAWLPNPVDVIHETPQTYRDATEIVVPDSTRELSTPVIFSKYFRFDKDAYTPVAIINYAFKNAKEASSVDGINGELELLNTLNSAMTSAERIKAITNPTEPHGGAKSLHKLFIVNDNGCEYKNKRFLGLVRSVCCGVALLPVPKVVDAELDEEE